MNALYRFFRSVRLAVVLLLVITVVSILATLVPQGREESSYRSLLGPGVARLVLAIGFDRFPTSPVFLAPVGLFIVNLATCTVHRVVSRSRRGAERRHGPDLVHIGLLVLAIGGVASSFLRREAAFTMGVGDAVDVTGGYRLELVSFESLFYDSGMPRDWISTVRVSRADLTLHESFRIEVNRPLRLGLLSVYQTSYGTEATVHLRDAEGATYVMEKGDGLRVGDAVQYLVGAERDGDEWLGRFELWRGEHRVDTSSIGAGGSVGPLRVEAVSARETTGLTAVRDPGYIPVLAALLIGSAGLVLTFVQKRKEENS